MATRVLWLSGYEQLAEQWLQRLHPAEHSAVLLSHGWINEVWRNTLNRWQEDLAMRINRKARQLGFILTRDWIEIRSKRLDLLRSEPEVVEVPFDKYPALHARAMRETRGTYQRVLAANRSTWNHGGTRHGYSRCALIERLNKQGYHVINYRGEKRLAWKSLSGTFYTWVPS